MNRKLLGLLLFFISLSLFASPTVWQSLANGLQYTKIPVPSEYGFGDLHAFRFSLNQYKLALAFAKDNGRHAETAAEFAKSSKAIIAANGGFFSPSHEPLGLRINNGSLQHKLKNISWWGVFFIKHNRPYLSSMRNFRYQKNISFAIQGGPRLIVNGAIPKLKAGLAERTAICYTRNNQIIITATENMPLTTAALANVMRQSEQQGGLGCVNALNLDGGSSTQLYAELPSFHLSITGLKPVTDAIIVLPR